MTKSFNQFNLKKSGKQLGAISAAEIFHKAFQGILKWVKHSEWTQLTNLWLFQYRNPSTSISITCITAVVTIKLYRTVSINFRNPVSIYKILHHFELAGSVWSWTWFEQSWLSTQHFSSLSTKMLTKLYITKNCAYAFHWIFKLITSTCN